MLGSMFKKENLRGPSVFFGIGEERPYYVEKTPSLLAERLRHNFTFFYLNYLLVAAILFCLTLVVHVSTIIGLALLAGAWMWLIRATQDGNLRIGSKSSTVPW
jgi:PRA1 family protein